MVEEISIAVFNVVQQRKMKMKSKEEEKKITKHNHSKWNKGNVKYTRDSKRVHEGDESVGARGGKRGEKVKERKKCILTQ